MNNLTTGWATPTAEGTQAPTQNVFGPEYQQYNMYSLEGDGRIHVTLKRDSVTGELVKSETPFSTSSIQQRQKLVASQREKLYEHITTSDKISFVSQAESALGDNFIRPDADKPIPLSPYEHLAAELERREMAKAKERSEANNMAQRSTSSGLAVDSSKVEKFAGLREVLMQEAMQAGGGLDGTDLLNPDAMLAEALDKMSSKYGLSTAQLGLRKVIPEQGDVGDFAVPPHPAIADKRKPTAFEEIVRKESGASTDEEFEVWIRDKGAEYLEEKRKNVAAQVPRPHPLPLLILFLIDKHILDWQANLSRSFGGFK
jgi:hypothetical protein